MDQIIQILEKEKISAWRLTQRQTDSAELYFIKKKLDLPRYTKIEEISLEVFRDFEEDGQKFRGATEIFIEPGSSPEEIERKIRSADYAASFVRNPFYELPEKTVSGKVASAADYSSQPITAAAEAVADVLLSVKGDETAFINSAEIFIRRSTVRILDSKGTDVSYDHDSVWGEFVTQCVSPSDVEQYRQFSYGNLDLDALRERLESGIRDVRLRAGAKNAPKAGKYNVILTGENLREILTYYSIRSSSAMIYPQYSTWKTGDQVQGENVEGEKINLTLSSDFPFSGEGIALKDRPLIRDGKLCAIHGNSRFAYYLGIEPTGSYEKLILDAGTMSYEDMKRSGALEAVSFSDFQMDPMDGHFAGEMRLALQTSSDGTVTAMTGGSVNGNIITSQKKLVFSKERYRDSTYEGPLAVMIADVTVAGE